MIVLLGYIQNVIVQTSDVEEATSPEDIAQTEYAFMADSKAGEVPEKYFLDVSRNFTVSNQPKIDMKFVFSQK